MQLPLQGKALEPPNLDIINCCFPVSFKIIQWDIPKSSAAASAATQVRFPAIKSPLTSLIEAVAKLSLGALGALPESGGDRFGCGALVFSINKA